MTLNAPAAALGLFAAETNTWGTALEQLRNGFNLELLGAVASILAAVWWISAIYLRRRGDTVRKVDNPQRLYRDLVRAHRLSWAERALLEQLAEARDLDDAAVMFVRDDYFTVAGLAGEVSAKGPAVEKLRAKLFANSEVEVRNSAP